MSDDLLTDSQRIQLGERIDRLRHAKRLTLTELATIAGYDERTVRTVIQGKRTRYKTLMDLCEAVGLSNVYSCDDVAQYADEPHGSYSKKSFRNYLGAYLAYRRSYGDISNIFCSLYELSWEDEKGVIFSENQRRIDASGKEVDFSQKGEVFANEETGLMHFVTIVEGMVRLITLTRLQPGGLLKGAVLSQAVQSFYRRPASSPIFFKKLAECPASDCVHEMIGEISRGGPGYAEAAAELEAIENDVLLCKFRLGSVQAEKSSDLGNNVRVLSAIR